MTPRQMHGYARTGFTLIEILIVLAIVVMISGLAAVALFGQREKADVQATQINLGTIGDALDAFRLDYRRYPTDEEGVAVLWDREQLDADAESSSWIKYLEDPSPRDVWGNAWGYAQESEDYEPDEENPAAVAPYDLWSNGPDGEEGTDDDIRMAGATGSSDGEDGVGSDLLPDQGP
ncbi:MAG: type II secretion system protein GspG [Phycisphaeraceae bacterium]|nr:MAG: type II secretion system protein GspG [Phycisphaeraceae bacterium]